MLAVSLFVCLVGELAGRAALPPLAWPGLHGLTFVLFCAAANFAWFAIFARFARRPIALCDSLAANAYGIYILHYPAVVWMQYALLDVHIGAIPKVYWYFPRRWRRVGQAPSRCARRPTPRASSEAMRDWSGGAPVVGAYV